MVFVAFPPPPLRARVKGPRLIATEAAVDVASIEAFSRASMLRPPVVVLTVEDSTNASTTFPI